MNSKQLLSHGQIMALLIVSMLSSASFAGVRKQDDKPASTFARKIQETNSVIKQLVKSEKISKAEANRLRKYSSERMANLRELCSLDYEASSEKLDVGKNQFLHICIELQTTSWLMFLREGVATDKAKAQERASFRKI